MDFEKYSDLENHGYFQPPPKKSNYAGDFQTGYKAGSTLFDAVISIIHGLFSVALMLLKGLYSGLRLLASTAVYLITPGHKNGDYKRNRF